MSLLDAFLEDGLAASVLAASDVWFAIRKDGEPGSGTQEDPFDGSTATHFDAAMEGVAVNTTIHLGPGTFQTQGTYAQGVGGWRPKSGQRILGAGIYATTLQVVNSTPSVDIVAIGKPIPEGYLEGFELSDLTIDCNLAGSGASASIGGVSVTGRNVLLRRVRVMNYGRKGAGLCVALSAAWANIDYAPYHPHNCVIEECTVLPRSTASQSGAKLIALRFGSVGTGFVQHNCCVIRNCYVDGGDSSLQEDIRGIVVSGGVSTVVEGNRILNCQHGGPYQDASEQVVTWDLIVRNNVYCNVREGVAFNLHDYVVVDRLIVLNNWMELGASGQARGIHLERSAAGGFASVILRGNVVRYQFPPVSPDPTDYGIRLKNCVNSIVENNVIDVGEANNAVYHTNCGTVKPFNNQTSAGVFRPGFNDSTHDQELTTEVEDVLLGLLMR